MRFRFDAGRHEYILVPSGQVVPHITGLLEREGLVDSEWYTEESRIRGSAVHRLTADYDLGAIENLTALDSPYKMWLLAHVEAMAMIPHEWHHIEVPRVKVTNRGTFAGTIDRDGTIYGAEGVLEIKSGDPERAHEIQTALQCILRQSPIPPRQQARFALYLKRNGKFKLEEHVRAKDFDKAEDILWRHARAA